MMLGKTQQAATSTTWLNKPKTINDEHKDVTSTDIMFKILEYSTPTSQPTKKPPQTQLGGSR